MFVTKAAIYFKVLSRNNLFVFFPLCIQTPGKYTVVTDYEKGVSEEFAVKGGDLVQLIREGEDGLWYADLFGIFIHNCVWKADAEGKTFKGNK